MPDDSTAHLIFASNQANHNFSHVLGDLRRAHLSRAHRLQSIDRDATFVNAVAAHFAGLPLIANERCGRWYIRPSLADTDKDTDRHTLIHASRIASAYFKSTDGHTGQWAFSTRRLNLHLLPLLAGSGGCILVDSTRRGKRMPDALSKTVPLWCCVVNRALFGDDADAATTALYTPPDVVSLSEHGQMLARVPAAVGALRRLGVLEPDPATWRRHHLPNGKPLRPVWVTPDIPWPALDLLPGDGKLADRFNLVVCCTASRAPPTTALDGGDTATSPDYVQGAADDTENWALGLTPDLFWDHRTQLLATPEADLPTLIQSLVQSAHVALALTHGDASTGHGPLAEHVTNITAYLSAGQWTGTLPPDGNDTVGVDDGAHDGIFRIVFVRQAPAVDAADWVRMRRVGSTPVLAVGLGKQDKIAGRNLRHALLRICASVQAYLSREPAAHIHVLCATGRDLAVGTALALLCWCGVDETGRLRLTDAGADAPLNKDAIRKHLGRIMMAIPHANPSRTTLQSVNSFLMDSRDRV